MAILPITNPTGQFPLAGIGQVKSSTLTKAVIASGAAAQVTTVTYGGSPSAGDYTLSFTIDGGTAISVTYTAITGDTNALVAAGMASAINNKVGVSGYVLASSSSTTLTVRGKGTKSFTLSSSAVSGGTQTVNANTTEAAAAADVEVGRAMIRTSEGTDQGTPNGKRPLSTNFTAQSQTWTLTSAASAIFWVDITINGVTTTIGPVAHNTNTATTIDDIDAAVDAAMDALADAGYNVVATNTDTTLILTADVPGASFTSMVRVSGSASADAVGPVFNGRTYAYELRRALLGFATNQGSTNTSFTSSDGVWPGGQPVSCAYKGEVCLASSAPADGSGFWVSVASGSEGRVYSSGGTNRVWLGNDLWTADGYANLDKLLL